MADLNKELSEYLLNSKNEKQYKLNVPNVSITRTRIGRWFGRNGEVQREESGWLKDSTSDCCPSLVGFPSQHTFFLTLDNCHVYSRFMMTLDCKSSQLAQKLFTLINFQTRLQRLTGFCVCFFMGILCFCLSAVYIPVLLLKARKFALLYTLGSVFFLMR